MDINKPLPDQRDFFFDFREANKACLDRLTVLLQYGQSGLDVVRAVRSGWSEITPCLTEDEIRTWSNIRFRSGARHRNWIRECEGKRNAQLECLRSDD